MFQAAFCLAFMCFLCSGELTWEMTSTPGLTVGSIDFALDGTFATIYLPSSKTNPFGDSITLTEPAVPHHTCAVKVLWVICAWRPPSDLLLSLKPGLLFTHNLFLDTLSRCIAACSISPKGYVMGQDVQESGRSIKTYEGSAGIEELGRSQDLQ
ncbi:hypothetical protein NDA11_004790 [Ustilago hordei]|nr:hypothetical protein NDA10_004369 [Ustilago hordei]KAJ1570850.1 hypothetical protein NDA11_004790 [Ustilago hordei]KAJ1587575.1 hypothetical protein NDA15_006765 [Ustilago hordei]KAJ1590380.1 hypothetical protein NDA12_006799 [Ustilago hordei]UTT96715.1 hypothetical protein NDA17_001422 [Ustilago hordei]